jgi:hypothetical protein
LYLRFYSILFYKMASAGGGRAAVSLPASTIVAASVALELVGGDGGGRIIRRFDPVAVGLDATFRLTNYADLKG